MYQKILVALDNSLTDEAMLPHIAALAKMHGSALLLLHVADGWVARNYQFFRHRQKHNSLFDLVDFDNKELFSNYLHKDKEELEAELQKHNQFMTVLTVLKTLPNKYQEVISLRYFEGKENKEIVEILNINEGTLKSLISRGLEKLREKCNRI